MLVCLSNSETEPASLLTLVTEGLSIKKVVSIRVVLGSSVGCIHLPNCSGFFLLKLQLNVGYI